MGRSGVAKLSPALVQQILSGTCSNMPEPVTPEGLSTTDSERDTMAAALIGLHFMKRGYVILTDWQTWPLLLPALLPAEYLYATVANVIITLIAMLGIVMLLCTSCTNLFQMCVQFCISMAVGALTGDALLHLIPMVGEEKIHYTKYICSVIVDCVG